jgi:hypothetical protein
VTEAEVERSLAVMVEALEAQASTVSSVIEAVKELMARDLELQEGLVDIATMLDRHASRARLLYSMKASTLTTTCLRCGTAFASEPGPALCGPCWTELGRPNVYLSSVPTPGA